MTADGETPRLVQAVKAGDRATALALARDAQQVAAAEADGTTALHWAVRQNDQELVDRLLRTGADVNVANRYGVTPLKLAAINGDAKLLERLLDAGGDANTAGRDGETLLMTAARGGHVEAARLLLERGAQIDARESWHGQTALMWAAARRPPRHAARAAEARCRRQRTLEPRRVGAPDHLRAARQMVAAGRPDAPVVRRARELPRVRAGAGRGRRRRQRHDPGWHQPRRHRAHQQALRRRRRAHRSRHRPESR